MGIGDDCVVDPTLRVRGLQNLWIADASVVPDAVSANLNAVSILIGAKLGQQLARAG
jgi:choline dehydrogenase-like flavoprotein